MRVNLGSIKSKNNYFSGILILLFTGLHLVYIHTPFVNLEWVYRHGSQFFLTGDPYLLEQYFFLQANPITYSFLVSQLITFLGLDQFAIYRFPSLIGGILLLVCLARYQQPWLVAVVALNPLIWIYSGRAYSELLAVGLMMLAYEWRLSPVIGGLTAAFSGMVKYHTMPFLLLYTGLKWGFTNLRERLRVLNNAHFWITVITLLSWGGFLVVNRYEFGFWLAPEKFHEIHGTFSISNWLNNFFSYGYYLSALFFLTIPAFINKEYFKYKLLLLVLSILLAFSNQDLGEMDFGSYHQLLGTEVILLIKIISFWSFLLCCHTFWKDEESRILLLTILGYIALLSLTRPANRYLIFVIPFWAMLIFQHISLSRLFWWGYVSILVGLNLFASLYQVSNATASARMAEWAVQNDIKINLGGIVYAHVGDSSHHDPKSNLVVSLSGPGTGDVLHEETVTVLGFPIRSYVLTFNPISESK